MMIDKLMMNQSIIITLDIDALLFKKIEAIYKTGFSVIEINSAEPTLLKKVLQDFPMLRVGAGNIISTQQLEDCYQAGVHFITSPGLIPSIAQTANVYSINYLPGVATMSEAMQASHLGCHNVRPFPAALSFCAQLNKCLPLLRLFPAEVEWEEAEHFLTLPSVAAVSIINPEIKQLAAQSQFLAAGTV